MRNDSKNIVRVVDKESNREWAVRIIGLHDNYGLRDKLVKETTQPCIEFFDAKGATKTSPLGQFVSRYLYETIIAGDRRNGLDLYGGVPEWKVSADLLTTVVAWSEALPVIKDWYSNGCPVEDFQRFPLEVSDTPTMSGS
jgi:hypothetical protein